MTLEKWLRINEWRNAVLMSIAVIFALTAWNVLSAYIPAGTIWSDAARGFDMVIWLLSGGLLYTAIQEGRDRERIAERVVARVTEALREHSGQLSLLSKLGIVQTYENRNEAAPHVLEAIAAARSRVCVVGVSLSECLSAKKLLNAIPNLLSAEQVRIVNMYGVCDAAVVRATFDAAGPRYEKDLISGLLDPAQRADTFAKTSLYRAYAKGRDLFARSAFADRVRYYTCQPPSWMVIVDDRIFVEGYTFASACSLGVDNCAGADLRVSVVEPRVDPRCEFNILVRHFENLWTYCQMSLADTLAAEPAYQAHLDAAIANETAYLQRRLAAATAAPMPMAAS